MRRSLPAMLVALLAILVIECVAFNMPFWTTLGASTDSAAATNVMGDGLKRGEDGILTVTDPTSAYMEVSADGTSSYVRIEAANTPEGGDVKAASRHRFAHRRDHLRLHVGAALAVP